MMNQITNFSRAKLILKVDSGAALLAGLCILLLPIPFEEWYSLPRSLFLFTGIVNLIYGLYSGSLVTMLILGKPLPRLLIHLLIAANTSWSLVCIGIVSMNWKIINIFGIAQISFEGVFVLTLAALEYYFVRKISVLR